MKLAFGLVAAVLIASGACHSQDIGFEPKPKSYISYSAEPQTIAAGKSAIVDLRFRVHDGFHVNSHTPKSELLIPTKLTFQPAFGVKIAELKYPVGTAYSFDFDPSEKLDVYSGPFTVKLPVVAEAGEHRIAGTLRYQACDHAACYPPKTLAVEVLVTAK